MSSSYPSDNTNNNISSAIKCTSSGISSAIAGLLALVPVIVIPIIAQPNLSPSDDVLIILFALFALVVTIFRFESSAPATTSKTTSSSDLESILQQQQQPIPYYSQLQSIVAFLMWTLFRTIVTIDSLDSYRPKYDVQLTILMHIGAFFSLLITITLYQQIIKHIQDRYHNNTNEESNIWWSITIQLMGFMLYFMAMLLQLLIKPPLSPMIYVLNFILIVYTAYAIVSIFGSIWCC